MRSRAWFVFTVLLLLGAACQPSPPPATQPAPKPSPAAPTVATPAPPPKAAVAPAATPTAVARQVLRGGTLVTVLNADPPTFNTSWGIGTSSVVGCKILEGLVSAPADGSQIRPELAASWQISPDGLTYTFRLQQGVLWHDGKPFTSEDVKWSYENLNKFHPIGRLWFEQVSSIQAPDPQTIVFKMKAPFAPLLRSLTCADGGAVSPKHLVEPGADARRHQQLNQAPIGTGPFVLKERVAGDRVTLVRNDKYWKKDLPYLDQIAVKIMPSTSSMFLALRAGEINYLDLLFTQKEDLVRLRDDPKFEILGGVAAPTFQHVQLNLRRPPLDKVEVRRALLMGIDRTLLLNQIYAGFGKISENMIDERLAAATAPDVNLVKMYPFDLARANKLLDDAGLPRKADGTRFQLKLLYEGGRGQWKEVSEVLRANWGQMGVRLTVESVERTIMLDKVFKKRDFDTTLQTYASRGDPALGVSRVFTCEDDKNPPEFGNPTGYCRQDADQLFAEAAKTPDFEKRRETYRKVQKILAEDLSILPFIGVDDVSAADKQFDLSGPRRAQQAASGWEYVFRLR